MNPKKVKPTLIAVISAIVILLATASLTTPIPDQILLVNSSSELDLSAYFPEFQDNAWFSVSRTGNVSVVFGKSLSEPWKFYRNPSVTIVPFKNWIGEETIEFKATNGTEVIKKSLLVRVVPSTTTTTTLMNLIEKASAIITESIQSSGRKIGISSPVQSGTSWKDNFSDSTGISTISNLNFSTGNISISNSPWFYPNHEYRKPITISRNIDPWWNSSFLYRTPITINNTAGNLTNYQVYINLTSSRAPSLNWSRGGNDTRFVYYNSSNGIHTNLNYWIESWNSTANTSIIWVNVTSLINNTNTTIYLYYGNPSATYNNSLGGSNTFEFFDDFNDNTKTGWSVGLGTDGFTETDGRMQFGVWTAASTLSKGSMNTIPFVMEFLGQAGGTLYNPRVAGWAIYTTALKYLGKQAYTSSYVDGMTISSGYSVTTNLDVGSYPSSSTLYKIIYNGTNIIVWAGTTKQADFSVTLDPTTIYPSIFGTAAGDAAEWPSYWDNFRVRKYASPEPSASFGAEQPYSLTDYQVAINLTTAIYNNTGLVGSWHFSEGSGNRTADSSGYGNDGTCYGAGGLCNWTTGKFGNGIQFDGTDDYVQNSSALTGLPVGNESRTMEVWVKPNVLSGLKAIVGYGSRNIPSGLGFALYTSSTNLYFATYAGDFQGTIPLSVGNWYHFVATYNGTDVFLYVNGMFDRSSTIVLNTSIGNPFVIGKELNTANYPFNGTIDEVRIYNRSLSAAEISEQYQAGKARLDYQDLRFTWVNSSTTNSFDNRTQILARMEISREELVELLRQNSVGGSGGTWMRNEVEQLRQRRSNWWGEAPAVQEEAEKLYSPSSLAKSSELYASTLDCSLNPNSSDQIAQSNFNANAKYSMSFVCGANSLLSDILSKNSSKGINLTLNLTIPINASKSLSENPDFDLISSLFLSSSTNSLNGADNSTLSENRISNVQLCNSLPLVIIPENNSLASITSFIYKSPLSLSSISTPSLTFLPNSKASFSVNLLLDANASNTNLCNSLLLFNSSSNTLSLINSFNISPISGSSLTSLSSSSGILTINSAITNNTQENYLNIPDCSEISEGYCQENGRFYKQEWKFFKDLNGNEGIATLKTEDPRLEWQKPTDYLSADFSGEMFEIELENGEILSVTPGQKVYGMIYPSVTLSQPSPTINNLPSKSLTPSKSEAVASTSFSGMGGWIRKTTIPENSLGGNKSALRKSVSRVSSTSFPSFANNATLPLTTPFGTYFTENPRNSKNSLTSMGIFSSSRNREFDIALSSGKFGSIAQCFFNHLPAQTWIAPQNLFGWFTGSNKFKDITDQNPGSFEGGLSMADICINNNAFANLSSHNLNIGDNYLNISLYILDGNSLIGVKEIRRVTDEILEIELENGEILSVTPGQRVYGAVLDKSISKTFLGDKTSTGDNSFNLLSPENIEQSNFSANARYEASFLCSANNSFALGKNSMNSEDGINVISPMITSTISSNSSPDSLVSFNNSSLCLSNSINRNSGAINSNFLRILFSRNTSNATPLLSREDTTTFTSTTNIYTPLSFSNSSYLLASDLFILSDISNAFSSVNLLLDCILFNRAILPNFSLTNLPTANDQSISETCLTSNSKSLGTLTTNSAISITSDNNTDLDLNNMIFQRKIIASTPLVSNNFSLLGISEIYGNLEGRELYFLDENFNPVRVKSIRKVPYSGKVYDVDVPNDVVLVRREITEGTWSGNTNSGTREVEIPYWLESDKQAWVKVPNVTASTVANTTLYMYYGNPSAASASNGTNTFLFFDDFNRADVSVGNGGSLGNGWTCIESSCYIASNLVGFATAAVDSWATNPASGNLNNITITTDFRRVDATHGYYAVFVRATPDSAYNWGNDGYGFYGTLTDVYLYDNGVSKGTAAFATTLNTWYSAEMRIASDNAMEVRIWEKGTTKPSSPTVSLAANTPASLGTNFKLSSGGDGGNQAEYDNYYIRKYASLEPSTLSVGAEQNKPRSGSAGSVQITPTNFLQWQNFSADSLLGWQYRKEINISNTAGNLTNYQVNVLLINGTNFNSSKAKANGSDIRFTAPLSYSGNGKWLYKKEIIVNNRVNPATWTNNWTLFNLVGVGGNDYNLDFSHSYNNGSDIRFYDPDTKSELNFSIHRWNQTTLIANLSVKIPSIPGNSDKRVWMFYGNPNAASSSGSVDGSYTGLNYSLGSEFSINSSYVEVPYWIESWNSSANSSLWVKAPFLQNGTNTTVYMYYGNAEAGAASNGANTFEFFDDFEDGSTMDADFWNTASNYATTSYAHSGSYSIIGTTGAKSQSMGAKAIPSISTIVWVYRTATAAYQEVVLFDDTNNLYGQINIGDGNVLVYNGASWVDSGLDIALTTWTKIEIIPITANTIRIFVNNVPSASNPMTTYTRTNIDKMGFATITNAYLDDYVVRKYASPEPNASVSATDTSGDFSAGVSDINYKILRNAGLADWKYRKPITINGSTSNLTDYQIPINLTTAIYNNTGLVGSWHFSEGTGNRTADSSGYGNDGTMYGGMNTTLDANLTSGWVSAGKFGNALRFDGTDDYVSVTNNAGFDFGSGNFVISAWFKVNDVGVQRPIFAGNTDLWLGMFRTTGNKMGYFASSTGTSWDLLIGDTSGQNGFGSITITPNVWHQVVFTRSGDNWLGYIDGVQDLSVTVSGAVVTRTENKRIGSWPGYYYFNGTIDEVRVYNRSLSATEIQEQYQAGKARLDYQDLRFTWLNSTSNAEQNISHWIESDNQAWVKAPNVTASSVANTTLYMYYGNPGATSASSGANTFIQFHGASSAIFLDSAVIPSSSGVIYEAKVKSAGGATEHFGMFKNVLDGSNDEFASFRFGTNPNYLYAANNNAETFQSYAAGLSTTTYQHMKLVLTGSQEDFYLDGIYRAQIVGGNQPDELLGLGMQSAAGVQEFSFARKYASPEPSMLSVGAEQNNTLCSGITAEQAKAGYSIAGCAGNITPISLYGVLETQDPTLKTPRLRQWNVTWSVIPTPPQIVLNTPANNSINNTRNINFTFTPTDADGFSSCELFTNVTETFASTETKTSITSGALNGINWTFSQDGKFLWNIRCSDTGSSSNFSAENRTLILDTTAPNITWNLPANDNSSIVGSWFVQNISVQDANLMDLNCTITNSSANVVWNTWWNLTGSTTFTVSNWTNLAGWNTGPYNETCIARDLTFFFGS